MIPVAIPVDEARRGKVAALARYRTPSPFIPVEPAGHPTGKTRSEAKSVERHNCALAVADTPE